MSDHLRRALKDAIRILSGGQRGYAGDHWVRTVQVNEATIERLRAALAKAAADGPPDHEPVYYGDSTTPSCCVYHASRVRSRAIALRELLDADALTASEVGRFADASSLWITVEAAEDLIERLTAPTASSSPDSDSAPGSGGLSSRDEGQATSWRPEPLDRVTAVEGLSSDVTSPGPGRIPPDAAGPGSLTRPAAPA